MYDGRRPRGRRWRTTTRTTEARGRGGDDHSGARDQPAPRRTRFVQRREGLDLIGVAERRGDLYGEQGDLETRGKESRKF